MIAERVPRQEIIARLCKDWKIKERQVVKYMTAVYARRRQEIQERRPYEIEEIEMTFERILAGAIQDREWNAARLTLHDFLRWRGYSMGVGAGAQADSPPVEQPAIEQRTQILIQELHVKLQEMAPVQKMSRFQELAAKRQKWIEAGGDPNQLAIKTEEVG